MGYNVLKDMFFLELLKVIKFINDLLFMRNYINEKVKRREIKVLFV